MTTADARPDQMKLQSSVLERGLVETFRRAMEVAEPSPRRTEARVPQPPWSITERYLTHGEHREWVERYAATSVAFADVLEALRNDQRERVDREQRQKERARRLPRAGKEGELSSPSAPAPEEKELAAQEPSAPSSARRAVLRLVR